MGVLYTPFVLCATYYQNACKIKYICITSVGLVAHNTYGRMQIHNLDVLDDNPLALYSLFQRRISPYKPIRVMCHLFEKNHANKLSIQYILCIGGT